MRKNCVKKSIFGLSAAFVMAGMIISGNMLKAEASELDKEITSFGTEVISDPVRPSSVNSSWQGDYIWYGSYGYNKPLKFRVLDSDCKEF